MKPTLIFSLAATAERAAREQAAAAVASDEGAARDVSWSLGNIRVRIY